MRQKRPVREEQETIIRFDEAGPDASCWTGSCRVAAHWRGLGIAVEERHGSWWATVPKTRVAIRRTRRANRTSFRPRGDTPPHCAAGEGPPILK